MQRHSDPRPLRVRIIEALKPYPLGLTARELAQVMGDWQPGISSIVSKMHTYGGPVEKVCNDGNGYGKGVRWRLRRPT